MMWTSHDTVGFVFLAGFCVQLGFSFEGKNCIYLFFLYMYVISFTKSRSQRIVSGSGATARRKAARSDKVLKVRSLFFFLEKEKDEMFKGITEQRKEGGGGEDKQERLERWGWRRLCVFNPVMTHTQKKMQLVIVWRSEGERRFCFSLFSDLVSHQRM